MIQIGLAQDQHSGQAPDSSDAHLIDLFKRSSASAANHRCAIPTGQRVVDFNPARRTVKSLGFRVFKIFHQFTPQAVLRRTGA
jgi:hypothetical protein